MSMLSRGIIHDTPVEFRSLRILALLPLVRVMGFPRDNVIGNRVRRLRGIGPESVLEAVGHVLLVASMIGVGAHWSVEVEAGVVARHEGAVDGYLVEIDADAMVLGVAVEEHAELEEWVWAIFDAWY